VPPRSTHFSAILPFFRFAGKSNLQSPNPNEAPTFIPISRQIILRLSFGLRFGSYLELRLGLGIFLRQARDRRTSRRRALRRRLTETACSVRGEMPIVPHDLAAGARWRARGESPCPACGTLCGSTRRRHGDGRAGGRERYPRRAPSPSGSGRSPSSFSCSCWAAACCSGPAAQAGRAYGAGAAVAPYADLDKVEEGNVADQVRRSWAARPKNTITRPQRRVRRPRSKIPRRPNSRGFGIMLWTDERSYSRSCIS